MERTAESAQEQAVVENLMDKQAYRIETSFMAAMDRFSSELRTLFQERMPIPASTTPPGAGRRSQECERLEPYGEGSSHGTPARAPTSGYGQNFQPPTNGWGQSQPTWANSGPTRPSEMACSPLHASYFGCTHPSWHEQYACCFVTTVRAEQPGHSISADAVIFPGFSPPLRCGRRNGTVHTPRSNSGRAYGTNRPNDNGRTPHPGGPSTKAAERWTTKPAASRSPAPRYTKPYPPEIDRTPLPRNYRLPEFTLFSRDCHTSSIEHIGRFTAQCGEADSDAHKLRLFVHSLTGAAFSWFINLPPNSTNREITVAELARMSQATDESPCDYLQRFKTCRNWCRTSLPEREFVKMAEEGLEFEYRKKFQGIEFRDMHDLINKVERYASLLKEEMQKKTASKGTYYRNPIVSYAEADGPTEAESEGIEVSSAEVKIDEPFICKGLVKADNSRTKIPDAKFATRETKAYTFDLTRAEAIFDLLLTEKKVKLSFGHKIPKPEELKGKTFCKYHSSWSHNTNNCVVLRDVIQKLIDENKLQFPEKPAMKVDSKPFPPPTINMVNAQLR
ncbi:unnamed protein product, partial [Prunus brigantina]